MHDSLQQCVNILVPAAVFNFLLLLMWHKKFLPCRTWCCPSVCTSASTRHFDFLFLFLNCLSAACQLRRYTVIPTGINNAVDTMLITGRSISWMFFLFSVQVTRAMTFLINIILRLRTLYNITYIHTLF
jgi:hypothetical protein